MAEFETVGHSVARLEGADKLSGRAVYVDDITRPGMLHGAVLLSPYPHARIVRIDTSAARAAPGVRCVLTGEDFPRRFGAFVHDEVVLAQGCVRYAGEPVAAIAADSVAEARAVVEGGAQGEHKLARGFEPVQTHSAHWLAHPAFADAVGRYLDQEREGICGYADGLNSPFRTEVGD